MSRSIIEKIIAREIIDSRAVPTVEAEVILTTGSRGRASVPAGASTGQEEAAELRDGDSKRFNGLGVTQAVSKIETVISEALVGVELDQSHLDQLLIELDGTANKHRLGANATLAVSLAFAQAISDQQQIKLFTYLAQLIPNKGSVLNLPRPMFNILNGGAHADNSLTFQEFMIVPQGDSLKENLRCGVEIYHQLKNLLRENRLQTTVGDEGGFAPNLTGNRHALELIVQAGQMAGYQNGSDFRISLDIAGNELKQGDLYLFDRQVLEAKNYTDQLITLAQDFSLLSIEDPFHEQDRQDFYNLGQALQDQTLIIGDDLLVTNPDKIAQASQEKLVNGVIIKPNQIGTVTETLQAVTVAFDNQLTPIVSHRSGETEDVSIAHLAVAVQAPLVKFGAPARGERTAKYNELLRIEAEEL